MFITPLLSVGLLLGSIETDADEESSDSLQDVRPWHVAHNVALGVCWLGVVPCIPAWWLCMAPPTIASLMDMSAYHDRHPRMAVALYLMMQVHSLIFLAAGPLCMGSMYLFRASDQVDVRKDRASAATHQRNRKVFLTSVRELEAAGFKVEKRSMNGGFVRAKKGGVLARVRISRHGDAWDVELQGNEERSLEGLRASLWRAYGNMDEPPNVVMRVHVWGRE